MIAGAGVHAWRLLELFEQFASTGILNISVEDFHIAMETTDTHKKNYNNLLKKIIEPAMWELVNKDNWIIGFKSTKLGRKVNMLRFDFHKNPQGTLF
jgi:plasmid replication initiation protein